MQILNAHLPMPDFAMTPRPLSSISDLIVHHTAGPTTQTIQEIDQEHRAQGWAMIGYDYVIAANGAIYAGRMLEVVPSAAYGRNLQSVDVVLIGNFQPDDAGFTGPPTSAQLDSLLALSIYLHQHIPSICRTIGHGDVALMFYSGAPGDYSTACPGTDLEKELPDIRSKTSAAIRHS